MYVPYPTPPSPTLIYPTSEGILHPEKKFFLYDSDGKLKEWSGLYAIVDGGYHEWRCLMAPLKHTLESDAAMWTKRLESVRKNVECTFGVLKKRFRILRLPFSKRNPAHIDDTFRACCTLHNMLLRHDDLYSIGRKSSDWMTSRDMLKRDALDALRSKTVVRAPHRNCAPGAREPGYDELREALIMHMAQARKRGALKWLCTAAVARPRNQPIAQPQGEAEEGEAEEGGEEVADVSPDEEDSE